MHFVLLSISYAETPGQATSRAASLSSSTAVTSLAPKYQKLCLAELLPWDLEPPSGLRSTRNAWQAAVRDFLQGGAKACSL